MERKRNKIQKKKTNWSSGHHHVILHRRPSPCDGNLRDFLHPIVAAIASLFPLVTWLYTHKPVIYCHNGIP
jgi:hypothetical protein